MGAGTVARGFERRLLAAAAKFLQTEEIVGKAFNALSGQISQLELDRFNNGLDSILIQARRWRQEQPSMQSAHLGSLLTLFCLSCSGMTNACWPTGESCLIATEQI